MTGWRADGRTNPRLWRVCLHESVIDSRCTECKALAIHGEQSQNVGHGGVPIGSPLLLKPMTTGGGNLNHMKGDPESRARFNYSMSKPDPEEAA